ncbi:MAG: M48 family metallopeptidase [Deltaproteobacteria bacterium]
MSIEYNLIRSPKRRKTISLQIGSGSEITIYAPHFTPLAEINRFVEEKQNWIDRAIKRQAELRVLPEEKAYVTGDFFYYLGRAYPLEAYFDPVENAGVVFWDNRFFLNCPENKAMKKHYFISWYKKKALIHINERVDFYRSMLKLASRGVRISSAERRWGSCSQDDHLSFSFRLIMAPPQVVDYVVVHELMHIRQKNHSSKFWKLVIDVLPDYKEHRRWLRDHQHHFNL